MRSERRLNMQQTEPKIITTALLLSEAERVSTKDIQSCKLYKNEENPQLTYLLEQILLSKCELNLDYADMKEFAADCQDMAVYTIGSAEGRNAASLVAIRMMNLILYSETSAKSLLLHANIHPNYPLDELTNMLVLVNDRVEKNVYFGLHFMSDTEKIKRDPIELFMIVPGNQTII
jgi:hypothetical protein